MFGKKKEDNFEATKDFNGYLKYNDADQVIKIKGYNILIPVSEIADYELNYGNKTITKKNLVTTAAAGAVFGLAGVASTANTSNEYVSNVRISIKTKDGRLYIIPMILGRIKLNYAKSTLRIAEQIINFLDEITQEA
ncbi:MAG: hypothetical protein ACI3T9_01340 [Romboutsia timonensis]